MVVLLVIVGIGALVWLRVKARRNRGVDPAGRGGSQKRRPMTWVVLAFNVLMLIWLIAGISTVGNNDCASQTYADACQAGANVGASIGLGLILFVWALGDVILGVVWMVTRKAPEVGRTCPVCGSPLAVGLTVCPTCGHDFRSAAAPLA